MAEKENQVATAIETLRSWFPRLLLCGLLLLAMVPLFRVFSPFFGFLLMAVSITVLTAPILFAPLDRWIEKRFPNWNPRNRRTTCGIACTVALLVFAATPFVLWLVGSGSTFEVLMGLAFGDEVWRQTFLELVTNKVAELKELYEWLPFDVETARVFAEELVGLVHKFSSSFLGYLFLGASGFIAKLALSMIALSFLFAHGPELTRSLLLRTGCGDDEVQRLARLHRKAVQRLWWDTILTASARGICLGGVGWLVGGFGFWPVALVGAFVGLVPVVGAAMVWLPLASLAWSRGDVGQAVGLALACLVLNALVSFCKHRLGSKLHEQGAWMSFLLFFSIIGGVLTYGPAGFVIGPAAVIGVTVIGSYFLARPRSKTVVDKP